MEPEIRRPLVEVSRTLPAKGSWGGFILPLTPSLGPPVYPKLQKHVKMQAKKLKSVF